MRALGEKGSLLAKFSLAIAGKHPDLGLNPYLYQEDAGFMPQDIYYQ
jgi:hypothetical protein